jgi:hypothetical protein
MTSKEFHSVSESFEPGKYRRFGRPLLSPNQIKNRGIFRRFIVFIDYACHPRNIFSVSVSRALCNRARNHRIKNLQIRVNTWCLNMKLFRNDTIFTFDQVGSLGAPFCRRQWKMWRKLELKARKQRKTRPYPRHGAREHRL